MKIYIKCDCCEHNDLIPNDLRALKKKNDMGKSVLMIKKVVYEISLVKARRGSNRTYSA